MGSCSGSATGLSTADRPAAWRAVEARRVARTPLRRPVVFPAAWLDMTSDPPAPLCLFLAFWAPQLAATRRNGRRVQASGKLLTSREIGSVQQPPATRHTERQNGPGRAVNR